jgi:glycosyltransferase involved in cell wall biosynthesis
MRVALLHPCYWPEVRRGSERVIRELADGLVARGHEPLLITSHPGATTRTVEDGLAVVRARRPDDRRLRDRGWDRYLAHGPRSLVELARAGPDVAHAIYPADAVAAAPWARVTRRPLVFSYMGLPDAEYLGERRGRRWTMVQACRRAGAVVALSQASARAFDEVLGVEARVISPGVDLGAFSPDQADRAPAPTIVCAAAIAEPRKRVALLVEAFALVRRERPDARLVLNRPRGEAPAFASAEGVELADLDDRAALAGAYRSAWVSALPSVNEAFGLVLAEALACGTPGVAANRGGMPEVLGGRDDVGRTFAGGDAEGLAVALLGALELHEDAATPRRCREQAERFSTDRTTDAYVALYEELAQRRRSRRNGSSTTR